MTCGTVWVISMQTGVSNNQSINNEHEQGMLLLSILAGALFQPTGK